MVALDRTPHDFLDDEPQTSEHRMRRLEQVMLLSLLDGNFRHAILLYHDAMAVDIHEARAVVRVLASVHGIPAWGV